MTSTLVDIPLSIICNNKQLLQKHLNMNHSMRELYKRTRRRLTSWCLPGLRSCFACYLAWLPALVRCVRAWLGGCVACLLPCALRVGFLRARRALVVGWLGSWRAACSRGGTAEGGRKNRSARSLAALTTFSKQRKFFFDTAILLLAVRYITNIALKN